MIPHKGDYVYQTLAGAQQRIKVLERRVERFESGDAYKNADARGKVTHTIRKQGSGVI